MDNPSLVILFLIPKGNIINFFFYLFICFFVLMFLKIENMNRTLWLYRTFLWRHLIKAPSNPLWIIIKINDVSYVIMQRLQLYLEENGTKSDNKKENINNFIYFSYFFFFFRKVNSKNNYQMWQWLETNLEKIKSIVHRPNFLGVVK